MTGKPESHYRENVSSLFSGKNDGRRLEFLLDGGTSPDPAKETERESEGPPPKAKTHPKPRRSLTWALLDWTLGIASLAGAPLVQVLRRR